MPTRRSAAALLSLASACTPVEFTEPAAPPREGEPDPSLHYTQTELQAFNTLVFFGNPYARMRKWDGPIRIRLAGTPTAEDSAAVADVASQLAAAFRTIPVALVEAGANVEVMFMPDTAYHNLKGGNCSPPGRVWGISCPTWDAEWRYQQAAVYITSLQGSLARRYLAFHELMHMAGFYDHPAGMPSVLARPEILGYQTFQPLDLALLEMMGRAELRPGMLGEEAMAILRELKPEGR
jgi:hypothetical protein